MTEPYPIVEPVPAVWESRGVKSSPRMRRFLAVAAMAAVIALGLTRFLTHTPYQRLGVRLDWNNPMGQARVADIVGPPGKGLLQRNDVLVELDGQALTRDYVAERFKKGWPRDAIALTIERRGERRSLILPPLHLSTWQRVRTVTVPLIGVVAAPLVAFLLVWRRPDLTAAQVFFALALIQALGAVWNLFRFPQFTFTGPSRSLLDFYHALIFWFPAVFLHFMTVFPRPRWNSAHPTRSVWFWVVIAAYATPPALFLASRLGGANVDTLYIWFQSVAIPLGSLALIERYARPPRPEWSPMLRERVIAVIVAVTLLCGAVIDMIPDDSRMVALFSLSLFRVFYTVLLFGLLAVPLLIAYLVANDPAFDPRRLVVRSLPYALLSAVVAAVYLAVVLVSERLFAEFTGETTMTFNVIAALIVAFAFAPLRERLQRALDRLFGRDPRALRMALDQAGRDLLRALDRDEVVGAVEAAVTRGLKRRVEIVWPENGMPSLAEAEEVRDEERSAIESLLIQAGIRLENLALQEQRAADERNAVELREAAAKAELRALHAQVQPHFLFNALNALSYLTETDPPAAQRFTERLADMLRYTVQASDRRAALLSEEISFVEDYLGVARERYENPLCFEYRGKPELLSLSVPPLLLQPLVENSLKHGCAPDKEALHLSLEAQAADGWLTMVFRDDGRLNGGRVPGLGVGLQNLEHRLRSFAGNDASMAAGPAPAGGYEVRFRWRANGL